MPIYRLCGIVGLFIIESLHDKPNLFEFFQEVFKQHWSHIFLLRLFVLSDVLIKVFMFGCQTVLLLFVCLNVFNVRQHYKAK